MTNLNEGQNYEDNSTQKATQFLYVFYAFTSKMLDGCKTDVTGNTPLRWDHVMNNKLKSFGTSHIVAPDYDGNWVEFTSKEGIEAGCQWENSRRFSQTSSTPFMTSPLVDEFGYLAQGPATNAVLKGTYIPPLGTDPYAQKLLKELKMDSSVVAAPPMKVIFSVDQHIKGWRKAREFTATGPLGLTFSHFIATTYDPVLASFDATMANIPYATGYSSISWQSGTDVMIPKSVASL
jgi:hypothetical protein